MHKELERLAKNLGIERNLDMPRFVKNPCEYMKQASVFVLSSQWEGFGIVIVEALACGCLMVSTDCPSRPAEILENGKYGLLVPPKDPKEACPSHPPGAQGRSPGQGATKER